MPGAQGILRGFEFAGPAAAAEQGRYRWSDRIHATVTQLLEFRRGGRVGVHLPRAPAIQPDRIGTEGRRFLNPVQNLVQIEGLGEYIGGLRLQETAPQDGVT